MGDLNNDGMGFLPVFSSKMLRRLEKVRGIIRFDYNTLIWYNLTVC